MAGERPRVWRNLALLVRNDVSAPWTALVSALRSSASTWNLGLSEHYLSVYVLFILLECSPSSPLVSFLNFSCFRTQLKRPLLDDI